MELREGSSERANREVGAEADCNVTEAKKGKVPGRGERSVILNIKEMVRMRKVEQDQYFFLRRFNVVLGHWDSERRRMRST